MIKKLFIYSASSFRRNQAKTRRVNRPVYFICTSRRLTDSGENVIGYTRPPPMFISFRRDDDGGRVQLTNYFARSTSNFKPSFFGVLSSFLFVIRPKSITRFGRNPSVHVREIDIVFFLSLFPPSESSSTTVPFLRHNLTRLVLDTNTGT